MLVALWLWAARVAGGEALGGGYGPDLLVKGGSNNSMSGFVGVLRPGVPVPGGMGADMGEDAVVMLARRRGVAVE